MLLPASKASPILTTTASEQESVKPTGTGTVEAIVNTEGSQEHPWTLQNADETVLQTSAASRSNDQTQQQSKTSNLGSTQLESQQVTQASIEDTTHQQHQEPNRSTKLSPKEWQKHHNSWLNTVMQMPLEKPNHQHWFQISMHTSWY